MPHGSLPHPQVNTQHRQRQVETHTHTAAANIRLPQSPPMPTASRSTGPRGPQLDLLLPPTDMMSPRLHTLHHLVSPPSSIQNLASGNPNFYFEFGFLSLVQI